MDVHCETARAVAEPPYVISHGRVAHFVGTCVPVREAKGLQECAEGEIIGPVELHVHDPGQNTVERSRPGLGRVAGKQDGDGATECVPDVFAPVLGLL